jgi:DUF2934 family protein
MRSDRQERISERAYLIWVAEGRVHGKDDEHWHRAEREIAEEELRVAAALANRAAGTAKTTSRRAPATPAGTKKARTTATGKSRATPATSTRRSARRTPSGSSSS